MPEISRFYGIIITMYYLDHPPPHFHVRYNEWRAVMRIEDLILFEGHLPARVSALVREWAALHRDELRANWLLAEAHRPLAKIQPLD
jgi:hypothetical protein